MSVRCQVSTISAFCRPTIQTPPLHNQLPSRYRSHKASYSNFTPKICCHGNDPQTLDLGYVFIIFKRKLKTKFYTQAFDNRLILSALLADYR